MSATQLLGPRVGPKIPCIEKGIMPPIFEKSLFREFILIPKACKNIVPGIHIDPKSL